jgi:hypothetical protein
MYVSHVHFTYSRYTIHTRTYYSSYMRYMYSKETWDMGPYLL